MRSAVHLLFLVFLLLSSGLIYGQNTFPDRIRTALRQGNSHELAQLFSSRVELIIDSERINSSKVSSSQAEMILRAFFKKYPPADFQYVYQGTSSTIQYSTGTYRSGDDSYLVYILLKRGGDGYTIGTLHLRREATGKLTARK
ncbi:MAG: DUF4783 domain-containing protein [Sphingobacteriaceae bacterium]|nr:DUF4783 domain-containing protein [Cytophagaceae bacterium]